MQQQLTKGTFLHGGTYKIEQVLGQGSFGITYLAIHTALDKKVAIKEFFMKELNGRGEDGSITGMSDGSLSMDYARKFQKEALNLARLEHPNIVRVTDSFEDNGTFYYVMDYIEGQNLNDYVKAHHVSQQEAVDIIRDVAKALMYMHEEKHMLHLDLKPGNVMRRLSDGHIFLIDFGLSKHYSNDGQPETSTTIGLGTVGYAPIEQNNQAKNGEFRPTIDIYALGATLYKLLTRETPPAASELVSDDELLAENLRKHNVSSNLTEVIVKAMLPNVRNRTQTVKAFIESLSASSSRGNNTVSSLVDSEKTQAFTDKEQNEETTVQSAKEELSDFEKQTCEQEDNHSNTYHIAWRVFAVIGFVIAIIVAVFNTNASKDDANVPGHIHVDAATVELPQGKCTYTGKTNGKALPDDPKGVARFDDGRVYKGAFVNGKMSDSTGNAQFTFPNGDTFVGTFVDNHFSKGTYTIKESGEYFIGYFDTEGQPQQGNWYDKNGNYLESIAY